MEKPIGEDEFAPLEDLFANVDRCLQCQAPIYADDDDSLVCIECGGRNRRWGKQIED